MAANKPLDLQVNMRVHPAGVTTAYTIKNVAQRSGFTAATLRYYEKLGLLPESARTPGGYRTYYEHTLARMAFIGRAKQLGCSLEEITELALAWEGGSCGPVQDRLRNVVANKVSTAQQQIVELVTLTAELQQAAASLESHRPDGPCDAHCGCISVPPVLGDAPPAQFIRVGPKPERIDPVPIACTLGSDSLKSRMGES